MCFYLALYNPPTFVSFCFLYLVLVDQLTRISIVYFELPHHYLIVSLVQVNKSYKRFGYEIRVFIYHRCQCPRFDLNLFTFLIVLY